MSKRPHLWLLLPWLTVGAVIAGYATGADRFLSILPYGLDRIAQNNIGWGLLVVTYGSSVRWVHLRFRNSTPGKDASPLGTAFGLAIVITVAHACVLAGALAAFLWLTGADFGASC